MCWRVGVLSAYLELHHVNKPLNGNPRGRAGQEFGHARIRGQLRVDRADGLGQFHPVGAREVLENGELVVCVCVCVCVGGWFRV